MNVRRIIPFAIGVIVVVALVGGFATLGTPEHQRRLSIDRTTVADLVAISGSYPLSGGREHVPKAFIPMGVAGRKIDSNAYTYRRIDATHYELCASFLEPSSADDTQSKYAHGSGRTCFNYGLRGAFFTRS